MDKEALVGRNISSMGSGPNERESQWLEPRGHVASIDAFVGQEYVGMGGNP